MMRRMYDAAVPLLCLFLLLIATGLAEISDLAPFSSAFGPKANSPSQRWSLSPQGIPQPPGARAPFLVDVGKSGAFRGRLGPQQFAFRGQGFPGGDEDPSGSVRVADKNAPPAVPSMRADAALVHKLDAARDCLKEESWVEAGYLLQGLLDHPDDALVAVKQTGANGNDQTYWTGIHREAERLLNEFPAAGREYYDARYAPRAKAMLAEARQQGDMSRVAEVARRYPTTAAGTEAIQILASHHLDRARYQLAAVCFERLLARRKSGSLAPAIWFQAALAFHRAADAVRARQAWDRLASSAPEGLRLGDKDLNLSLLKKELESASSNSAEAASPSIEDYPGLETRWTLATAHHSFTQGVLQAVAQCEGRTPILPAFYALPGGDRAYYRSHRGVHAIDTHTGKDLWDTHFAWSMDQMAAQSRFASTLRGWVEGYFDYSPHAVVENTVLGNLTSDGHRVFAVDDLAVPPYRSTYRPPGRWGRQEASWPDFGPGLTEATYHNRLLALDAASGKPLWEQGGYAEDPDDGELLGAYFLGPPLPIDGRLYGVVEKNSELLLVCLNAAAGEFLWKQPLAFAPTRLLLDPGRRLQASRPIFAHGVLICPTNAGIVLGVDIASPSLLWAYPYRTQSLTQSIPIFERRGRSAPSQIIAEWKAPLTLVDDDRVIFTAADEASIHCLSLRDGSLLWKKEKAGDDLWLAGLYSGKLLLAGRRGCRALDPADGNLLWRLQIGAPTGQGVARGRVYYQPFKETGGAQGPTIAAIDLDAGRILARVPIPAKELPGNLFFHDGQLLSHSATAITAYTRQKEKPKEEKDDKSKDEKPKDDSSKKDRQ